MQFLVTWPSVNSVTIQHIRSIHIFLHRLYAMCACIKDILPNLLLVKLHLKQVFCLLPGIYWHSLRWPLKIGAHTICYIAEKYTCNNSFLNRPIKKHMVVILLSYKAKAISAVTTVYTECYSIKTDVIYQHSIIVL